MVLEARIAELLQNQASRFLQGFSADQLQLGLLSGRIELQRLGLNPDPFDEALLALELPLVLKAGSVTSCACQVSLLQGELELTIDGLTLILGASCKRLSREEVLANRSNEMQKLEFVHMRSQCQRRNLELEMFRKLFSDYLARVRLVLRNVHVRVEVDGAFDVVEPSRSPQAVRGGKSSGTGDLAAGFCLGSCAILPDRAAVTAFAKANESQAGEMLLVERLDVNAASLYHEAPGAARLHVTTATYFNGRQASGGIFSQIRQDDFVRRMEESRQRHNSLPETMQLMPPTSISIVISLKSQPMRFGTHVDNCLSMDVEVSMPQEKSRFNVSSRMLEHFKWFQVRASQFHLWQFLHPMCPTPRNSRERWRLVHKSLALKRRIIDNKHTLKEALTMRIHCKEYIRLYKRKFNGPSSVIGWRQALAQISDRESDRLLEIELLYPADKVVNFRLMGHAELRTEMALNRCLDGSSGSSPRSGGLEESSGTLYRRTARELTPLEQLHLHGQHGYGVNIFRGLHPPPASVKIRVEVSVPKGMWWVCRSALAPVPVPARVDTDTNGWALALDCASQPVKLLLTDNLADTSVFVTLELPAAPRGVRPLALLLGRSCAAFAEGSPNRYESSGGHGCEEWLSVLEAAGTVYCCAQLKTMLTSSMDSPWDIFLHLSCGEVVDKSMGQTKAGAARAEEGACLRARLPLALTTGQGGPFQDVLKRCLSAAGAGSQPRPQDIADLVGGTSGSRDIALFRMHVRLPPLLLETILSGGNTGASARLPRLDGACHVEHGCVVDGFIIGMHNLRHLVGTMLTAGAVGTADFVAGMTQSSRWAQRGSGPSGASGMSLQPLFAAAPPGSIALVALAAACGVAVASKSVAPAADGGTAAISTMLRRLGLHNFLAGAAGGKAAASGPNAAAPASPCPSSLSLILVALAVIFGRRTMWDIQESCGRPLRFNWSGDERQDRADAEAVQAAGGAMADVHSFAAAALKALLQLGVPLHPSCLPLAAWAGAAEILEALADQVPGAAFPPQGLLIAAARGTYMNLQARQERVVMWLLHKRANVEERDRDGWSLLEWACWGGDEALVALALRAGLAPAVHVNAWPPIPDRKCLPPALVLATASRSPKIIEMLVRAAGDPHSAAGTGGASPLLLAVARGEYGIASQLLETCFFVSIEAALSLGHGHHPSMTDVDEAEAEEEPVTRSVPLAVQATTVLIDSIRRYARGLAVRSGEDGGSTMPSSSLRLPVLGVHPDEGFYTSGKAPFGGVLHPLLVELPRPRFKANHEQRPQLLPHWWRQRGSSMAWHSLHHLIEGCLRRGFHPDTGVMQQSLPTLPTDARRLVQQLIATTTGAVVDGGAAAVRAPSLGAMRSLRNLKKTDTTNGLGREVSMHCDDDKDFSRSMEENGLPEHIAQALEACTHDVGQRIDEDGGALAAIAAQGFEKAFSEGSKRPPCRGPWEPQLLRAIVPSQPVLQLSDLTSLRVVVLGHPGVGKSTAMRTLIQGLDMKSEEVPDGLPWLTVRAGTWPRDRPALAVHIWDAPSAPLPGLLSRLAADASRVPLLLVWVVDADFGPPREQLEAFCTAFVALSGSGPAHSNGSSAPSAPPRAIVVRNLFFGRSAASASPMTGAKGSYLVHGNLLAADCMAQLQKAFGQALQDVAKLVGVRPGPPSDGTGGTAYSGDIDKMVSMDGFAEWSEHVSIPTPWVDTLPAASSAGRLRGDSALLHPGAVTWAWAALKASFGFISEEASLAQEAAEGSSMPPVCDCRGIVSMDRLEHVLRGADGGASDSGAVAPRLLRALGDLGLICPIPLSEVGGPWVGCSRAVVPDLARRLQLSVEDAERFGINLGSNGKQAQQVPGQVPLAIRVYWDPPSKGAGIDAVATPTLRTALRDLLARGALVAGVQTSSKNPTPPRLFIDVFRFFLLEAGPTGPATSDKDNDALIPGFVLTFDLASAVSRDEDPKASDARRLTTLIVGASTTTAGSSKGPNAPFWDVYCVGPHAQWAWRALLGSGTSGPTFTACHSADTARPGGARWLLPPPAACLFTAAAWDQVANQYGASPTTVRQLFGLSWLFNGPRGEGARIRLLQSSGADPPGASDNPIAACCAALCGKALRRDDGDKVSGDVPLSSCADFEAALFSRSWRLATDCLNEVLEALFASSSKTIEPWAFCAQILARLAHDGAGAVAGSRGRALPLLGAAGGESATGGARAVALVPDGSLPILSGGSSKEDRAPNDASAGAMQHRLRSGPGLEAWLRLCRPAALWTAAGRAPGSEVLGGELRALGSAGGGGVGARVVDALQAALMVKLTEEHVAEVWASLDGGKVVDASAVRLVRRSDGTWVSESKHCSRNLLV